MSVRLHLRAVLLGAALLAAWPAAAGAATEIGWLGISIAEVSEDLAERLGGIFGPAVGNGVHVMDVLKGGPAEGALQRGDVIVRVDAQPIWEVRQLQRIIRARPVRRPVTLGVLRGSRQLAIPVTIGPMPADSRAQLAGERFGLLVRLREERAEGGPAAPAGVVVAFVEPESAAARADVKPMDRILEANGRPVPSLEEFEEALLGAGRSLTLLVERREAAAPLSLHLDLPR
ncbi:MAG: PDZ domain-containing protein [Candidatus Methylomirabilales bacterium]